MEYRVRTILFACVDNAGRSQMAEAFFNLLAKGKARNKPRMLTIEMIEKADRMITMGCGADAEGLCPASFIKTEDWALDDPKGQPLEKVRQIRDEVKSRVSKLLAETS